MTSTTAPTSQRNSKFANVCGWIALRVLLPSAILTGVIAFVVSEKRSRDDFRTRVDASRAFSEDVLRYQGTVVDAASRGTNAAAISAFVSCVQDLNLNWPWREAELNRCEVEATQLATARGADLAESNAAVRDVRLQLVRYVDDQRAQLDTHLKELEAQ